MSEKLSYTNPALEDEIDSLINERFNERPDFPPQETAKRAIAAVLAARAEARPVDMVLHCPACGLQHIDEATPEWGNPPHRSHLCLGCGHIWRPADVATNGVAALQTRGKSDSPRAEARPAVDREAVEESTGARAVIRGGKIEISIDVDALPAIVSGSCCCNALDGLWKVTDPAAFAKDVCHALNNEREDGTTPVHMMFDTAFMHAIEQGAEGIEEATEEEFEAEAARLAILSATTSPTAQNG